MADEVKEKVENIEEKIDEVTEKISETPIEDKDKEWREGINSALTTITEALGDLKTQAGASPEIMALTGEVKKLQAAMNSLKADLSKKSEPEKEAVPLSLETPPATSLETEAKPPVEEKEAPKQTRAQRLGRL